MRGKRMRTNRELCCVDVYTSTHNRDITLTLYVYKRIDEVEARFDSNRHVSWFTDDVFTQTR